MFRFLLAKLQMEYILSPRSVLLQMKRFETVPKGLYEAYSSVIERIEKSGRDGDADVAMRIISWIYHARRTLRMDELLEALVVDEYSQDANLELDAELDAILEYKLTPPEIVETCKGLVLFEETSGSVLFSHETVNGFIKELGQTLRLPSKTRLAKTCLIYLGSNVFHAPCPNAEAFQVRRKKYKLSLYASQYWVDHIRGDSESEKEVQNAIWGISESVGKWESMHQLRIYSESSWGMFVSYTGMSILHVIAANGLAMICRCLLDGIFNDNDRYG